MNILEAIKFLKLNPKVFHASTSEMFGNHKLACKFSEETAFKPVSPYAVSKVSAFYIARMYAEVYKIRVCTALSFNHESPFRHELFVTRKITQMIAS